MNKRSYILDEVKGIGIVLVVLYHALGKNDSSIFINYDNGLFNMIACFFMQMFMVMSGYLSYGKAGDGNWIGRAITRWLVPLLAFMLVYWGWAKLFPSLIKIHDLPFVDYIIYTLTSGFSGLVTWYIWCLILCWCMACGVEQIKVKYGKIPYIVIIIGALALLNIMPINIFGLMELKWYGVFFFVGYLLCHYRQSKLVKIGGKVIYNSLALFPLCGYLFNWMIPYQDAHYGIIGLATVFPALLNGRGILIGVMVLMALLGTACVYSIAKINRSKMGIWLLSYLGRISVGIYLLHIMFVGIARDYRLATVLALCISVALYEGLSRIRFTNKYLFGKI